MDIADSVSINLLLAVRIKGAADGTQLQSAVCASRQEYEAGLERVVAAGLLRKHERLSKYVLTPAGQEALAQALENERRRIGVETLEQIYKRFMSLDSEFKRLAGAWQMYVFGPPPILNDHKDPRYDERIIKSLVRLHHRLRPVLEQLEQQYPRYLAYSVRFSQAMTRLTEGAFEYFTNPHVDSCHNIWFELHEDLLCTTGRQRTE